MLAVYFKTLTSEPVRITCTRDGRIDFSALGVEFGLVPTSIKLNKTRYLEGGLKSQEPWKQIKADFKAEGEPLGSKEDPVIVDGQPAVSTGENLRENQAKRLKHADIRVGEGAKDDKSVSLSEVMLLKELPELPQDEAGLRDILFPNENGRLPVTKQVYNRFRACYPEITDKFLLRADGSVLCVQVSYHLTKKLLVKSEMDVSFFVGGTIKDLFALLDSVSPHSFTNEVSLNQRETSRSSSSRTGSTLQGTRPDTLVIASDCTFLVGEDKALKLTDAEGDLRRKLMPLSRMFYGPVMFILGYMAAGTLFQWAYLSKDMELKRIRPILDLSLFQGQSRFLLSVGYAYKLINKMADSVPILPGRRAMFTLEFNTEGERILDWAHDSVLKTIKHFARHREIFQGTTLEVIREAYEVAKGCKFLARAERGPELTANTYSVRVAPLGCEVQLDSEQDGKKFAQNVCTALAALHRNGIVHRDVRLPNIVKVFESQTEYYFMVIDLETVAKVDFELPEGFDCFRFWTGQTLEGKRYTPRSDMYHLGMVLRLAMKDYANAKSFIGDLISKQLDAEMALSHTWLSDEVL